MARPIEFNLTKEELKEMREKYTLKAIAYMTGFGISTIALKSREYGLVNKKIGVKNNG